MGDALTETLAALERFTSAEQKFRAAGADAGSAVGAALAAATYDTVIIRSSLFPRPVRVALAETLGDAGPPSPVMQALRLAVEVTGPAGTIRKAPWGEPAEGWGGVMLVAGVVLALVGVGAVVGYAAGAAGAKEAA